MQKLDLSNVKVQSFEPIPEGDYLVACTNASVKDTKDGSGEYINCEFTVCGSQFDGRKIFQMFNIKNKNVQAVEIGLSQLKGFMLAAGCVDMVLTDVSLLEGRKANAKVKIKLDSQYGDKNTISYFKPASKEAVASASVNSGKSASIPF